VRPPRLFLVAGEVSGDVYGADLVAALRRHRPDVELLAVGGPRMAAAGARCLIESSGWGLIGWVDVLMQVPAFVRRLARVGGAIAQWDPVAVVLIDFSAFNLELARRLRRRVPIAYFIPPMVTTRKGDRARRIARLGMRILAILPFEAEAYRAAGADVVFVGHPALDRVRASTPIGAVRQRLGIEPDDPLLALLPGSRRQELERHLPVIRDALPAIYTRLPRLRTVLPLASPEFRNLTEESLRGTPVPVTLVAGAGPEAYDALAAADFAVVASGTATLEALCLGVPHVVIYRLSPITYRTPLMALYARYRVAARWVALPSLLADRPVVPELVQAALTPSRLADVVIDYLTDPRRREEQRRDLLGLRPLLGSPGAADRAAREVLGLVRLLGDEGSSTIDLKG